MNNLFSKPRRNSLPGGPLLYAESISASSNQGSVMLSILNHWKLHGGNIYLSIYMIIQLEMKPYIGARTINGNSYFYLNYSEELSSFVSNNLLFSMP